jgi:hypothetical protein
MTTQAATMMDPAPTETQGAAEIRSASRTARRWKMRISLIGGATLLVAAGFAIFLKDAEAKPPLGKRWPAGQMVSMDDVDHSSYNALLKTYVDGDGYVDYTAWKRSDQDRRALLSYLDTLSRATPSKRASREAQLAFWINAYNAVTIEGILQEYPTTSIRKHTSKLGGYNIWKNLPLLVGNRPYSLDDIEHKVLRKMDEPRIHFAIVCAAVSCPRLLNEAYTAKELDSQLAGNSRDFFSRSQNLQVDRRSGTIYVSSIIKWFGGDFGSSQIERFTYLKPYIPKNAQSLAADPQTSVRYLDYNWNLNDQRSKPRTASRR